MGAGISVKSSQRETLLQLRGDPFRPSLRLHGLSGGLAGIQSICLLHSERLTLIVKVTEQEIVVLDIGSHNEAYR